MTFFASRFLHHVMRHYLLGSELLISLTDNETDPLMGIEPVVIAGDERPIYVFLRYLAPPGSATTATLVAFVDNRQVAINNRSALRFQIEAEKYYRTPLDIEWPREAYDGRVHQLNIGIAFHTCFEWREISEGPRAAGETIPVFEEPVIFVPDESWVPWLPATTK